MPDLIAGLIARLSADAGVSALTTNIYEDHLPQAAPLPALVLFLIDVDEIYTLSGQWAWPEARVQIDHYAATRQEAYELSEAVRASINQLRGDAGGVTINTSRIVSQQDSPDQPQDGSDFWRYNRIADYLIRYQQTTQQVRSV